MTYSHNIRCWASVVTLIILLSGGSSQTQAQTSSAADTFAGRWRFSFTGAVRGTGTMTVNPGGTIQFLLSIGKYQHLFTNPVSVTVANTGALNGDILFVGVRSGSIVGALSAKGDIYGEVSTPFADVGTVRGHFEKETGSGTYESVAGDGTWTAKKE